MITIDLNFGGKVNIWFEELPDIRLTKRKIISKEYKISLPRKPLRKTIIVELLLPRGGRNIYGLLGVDYRGIESPLLKVIIPVKVLNKDQKILNTSLISKIEPVCLGLFDEYAEYIIKTIDQMIVSEKININGELNFCYSACAEISSSGWIFSKLTRILLHGLFLPIEKITKESIENILNQDG